MYILEGNIGAGKSTFLTLIQAEVPEISISYEPLSEWHRQLYGQSLLDNFYQDSNRWAYTMETFAMQCRVKDHLIEQEKKIPYRIIERSIYSGHYCFSLNSYKSGFMNLLEWNLYNSWFNFLIPGKCKPPKGFIYLRISPQTAYERIKKRARTAESNIPLEYLIALHKCHENFLIKKEAVLPELKNVPVLVLDAESDFQTDAQSFNVMIKDVKNFLGLGLD